MASIIKALLAMRVGRIPAHLHFSDPNPAIDWETMPVRVTSEAAAWPAAPGQRLLAAVNGFGLSGTNAHVVLEGRAYTEDGLSAAGGAAWPSGAPRAVDATVPHAFDDGATPQPAPARRAERVLPLSARTPAALRALAGRYLAWLEERVDGLPHEAVSAALADAAWTAGTGRGHFAHRAGIAFRDAPALRARLHALASALAEADEDAGGGTPPGGARVALVYGGDALPAQLVHELYQTEPVFRAVLERCDRALQNERAASLTDVLFGVAGEDGGSDLALERASLYAVHAAMTALWQSVGVRPDAVFGRGLGELSAALAAGVLNLEDGLRLALALSGADAPLPSVALHHPEVTLVSCVTGGVMSHADDLDDATGGRCSTAQSRFRRRLQPSTRRASTWWSPSPPTTLSHLAA